MNTSKKLQLGRGAKIACALAIASLTIAACGGGTESTPTPRNLGGNTQVSGFTPTPTAGIRTPAPGQATPSGLTATPASTTGASPAPATGGIEISVVGNDLKFDKSQLSAKAGTEVKVTLKNNATSKALQHNWVLMKKGTVDAVGSAGLAAGPGNGWIPKTDPNVLAFVPLVDGGATGTATIKVPAAGTYEFACTFPGHPATMTGTFEATP